MFNVSNSCAQVEILGVDYITSPLWSWSVLERLPHFGKSHVTKQETVEKTKISVWWGYNNEKSESNFILNVSLIHVQYQISPGDGASFGSMFSG